jgi:hypothetical protein
MEENMNATVRNWIGYASLALVAAMQTGCAADPSFQDGDDPIADEPSAEDLKDVKEQTQALYYPNAIGSCESFTVARYQYSYTGNTYRNMQVYSENLSTFQREWWKRTDCAGLITDWVRTGSAPGNTDDDSAFISGIIPGTSPGVTDPATCELLWVSRKINTKWIGTSPGYWTARPVGSQGSAASWDELMGRDCTWDFNRIFFLAGEGASHYQVRAGTTERVRAVTQGFAWIYPAILSNYMQIEPDGGEDCATQCCIYDRFDYCG